MLEIVTNYKIVIIPILQSFNFLVSLAVELQAKRKGGRSRVPLWFLYRFIVAIEQVLITRARFQPLELVGRNVASLEVIM